MKEKISISQFYNLGAQHYQSFWEFDLINKKVKLVSQGVTQDFRKKEGLIYSDVENSRIAESLVIPDNIPEFDLSDEDCEKIRMEHEKMDRPSDEEINGIWPMSCIFVRSSDYYGESIPEYKHFDIEYTYVNHFPENWIEFGELLIDITGFDVFNINFKNLISPLYHNIEPDGVWDKETGEKLKLKKINYHISSFEKPYNPYNLTITSDDKEFSQALSLLDFYGVYMWYHEDSFKNITEHDDFNDFKGNSWFCELIFEDDKIMNLRGDNAFPDTYVHLGNELSNLKKDILRIKEFSKERLDFLNEYGREQLANRRDNVEKIEIRCNMDFCNRNTLHNRFTIDCENKILIPDRWNKEFNSHEYDFEITNMSISNVPNDNIILDSDKLDEFLEEFKKLNLTEDNSPNSLYFRNQSLENSLTVEYSSGKKYYRFTQNPESWIKLGGLLHDLVGFDILNIENSRYLVTNLYYYAKRDGIYDKQTGKKLKLKSIEYQHGAVLLFGSSKHHIFVDFDKKSISGCFSKEKISDEDCELILNLLEKYHLYELENEKYWQKMKYHEWCGLDGYSWNLDLIFENDISFTIGESNDYPDIFTHLAREIIDLTGKDVLNLKSVYDGDLELYQKYGDDILRG